jgi:hypothetical protein
MNYSSGLRSAVCTAALITGTAAHADLTAAQVWDDWKAQLELYGEDTLFIGAEETSSGTVTVRDLAMIFSEDDVTVKTVIGDINFNEQADGSVRITMDERFPMTISGPDGVVVTIVMTQSNLETIVSGSPELMEYDLTADSYAIAFQDVVDGDLTITGDAKLTATDMAASYSVATGETREISSSGAIGMIDLLVDFQIPGDNGEYVTAAAKINNMRTQSAVSMPLTADFGNPDDLFANGFSVAGGYIIDSADYVFDINAEGDQASGSVSTGAVTLTGELNSKAMGYDSQTLDIAVSVQSGALPMQIDLTMAEYGTGFRVPVGKTDAPADFGFKFDLIDLVVGDALWNLFDPNNVLPRDPATLQIALSGKAKALIDMLDPSQAAIFESTEVPFELSSVSLDTLKIMAAGALFTGTGAFTFDNDDTQTFAPLPRPEGDASFEITGLNKLLDNLVTMGLVPEQDVMGPRMMMGMFGRATGDDQMAIDVVVAPDGQVNINGNRVR